MLNRPEFALKAYSPSPRDSSCLDRAGESKAIDQPSLGISTLTGVAPAAPKNASTTARPTAAFTRVVAFMASPGGATAPFAKPGRRLNPQRYFRAYEGQSPIANIFVVAVSGSQPRRKNNRC